MNRILPAAFVLFLLLSGCGRPDGTAEPKTQDFALSLKVEASGVQVQSVALPAAVLTAFKRPDKGDIRIVDAHDRPLSVAFVEPNAEQRNSIHLDAIPFGSPTVAGRTGPFSVRVDQRGGSVSIHADGSEAEGFQPGVVFDTRNVRDPAVGIALDAVLPKQRPVTMSIATGPDLKLWEPLAEQVLFRASDGSGLLGGSRIDLPSAHLRGRYLRATWQGGPEVRISGATLFTSSVPVVPPISIAVRGLELADQHSLTFSVPSALMPRAMRVRMTSSDGVMPVRLLGRANAEAPWALLAMASLKQGGPGALLEIGDGTARMLRLEADPRSAGFSGPPSIDLQYAPVILAAAFNGDGPYRLVVGNSEAQPKAFALSDLSNISGPMAEAHIVGALPPVAIDLNRSAGLSSFPLKIVALWTVLLAGVALLAFAAFRLMRTNDNR